MNRHILLFLIMTSSGWLAAQVRIDVGQILQESNSLISSTKDDGAFKKFVNKAGKEISAIEKMEFRTETDRWDVARQEYTVRTSVKSKGEVNSEKRLLKSWEKIIAIEQAEEQQDRLSDLYELLLEIQYLQEKEKVQLELVAVAEDKKNVQINSLAYDSKVSPYEVLKTDELILDTGLDLAKLQYRLASVISKVSGQEDTKVDFNRWMKVPELITSFRSLIDTDGVHTSITKQEEQLLLKDTELSKEKAKGGRLLDFLQMKYSGNENILNGEQLSLGVSVLLPTGHANRENIREANIDVFRESTKVANLKEKLIREQEDTISDFEELQATWSLLKDRLAEMDLEGTLQKLAKTNGIRASTLLDIKQMILLRQLELLKLERSMYEEYIKLCELKGKLIGPQAFQIFNLN